MNDPEARDLSEKILDLVFKNDQWCSVEYKYRGKELHTILIKEISIKITE